MNEENKIPKFVTDLTNYLIAIKNLSQVYVKNMTITIGQFLEFINIHKLKNKYESIQELTLNDIRSLNNSDIYSFIFLGRITVQDKFKSCKNRTFKNIF